MSDEGISSYQKTVRALAAEIADLQARAETAEAAAGAMREALELAKTFVGTACDPRAPYARIMIEKLDKALSATLGTEVLRVVRAAEKYQEADDDEALDDTDDDRHFEAICIKARASEELSQALAALGGTHER